MEFIITIYNTIIYYLGELLKFLIFTSLDIGDAIVEFSKTLPSGLGLIVLIFGMFVGVGLVVLSLALLMSIPSIVISFIFPKKAKSNLNKFDTTYIDETDDDETDDESSDYYDIYDDNDSTPIKQSSNSKKKKEKAKSFWEEYEEGQERLFEEGDQPDWMDDEEYWE